jgi:hypothetical protein
LNKTAISISKRNHDVRRAHTASLNVDETQDECGESESREAERSWVGKLAVTGRSVKTWLELSSEGRETRRFAGIHMCQGVSSVVICGMLSGTRWSGAVAIEGSVVMSSGAIFVLLVDVWVCGSRSSHCESLVLTRKGRRI